MYNIEAKNGVKILMSNILTVYFSKSGHTKKIAEQIAKETSSTLHEITTEKKYPANYLMTILESRREFKKNEKLVLTSEPIRNFDSYEKIIIGFPIWFWTCPMAIVSFLEQYNFDGKEIFPFCTSGGSGCSKATEKIREICKGAKVHDGIKANTIDSTKISEWLK